MADTTSNSSSLEAELVQKVTDYVRKYMSHYDSSHDFSHIQRVLSLALHIASAPPSSYDVHLVTLSALLHDVGDRKYLQPGDDPSTQIVQVLLSYNCSPDLAAKVQKLCLHVSYTNEVKNPDAVSKCLEEIPELAVVQDADRLDAIGAVGIGRAFAYGGAKAPDRGLQGCVDHFVEKLERLEGMMKTGRGKELARERTERLKLFRGWWEEETRGVEG